ncbi:MAG: hypothetical protein AB8B69_08600 [Chitinophagales bacterium]
MSRALGGLSTSLVSPVNINYNNPASYASIRFTTFETALDAQNIWLKQNEATQSSGDAGLGYAALAFPLGNKGGLSMGILPFSKMNYDVTETVDNELLGSTQDYRFIGDGQTHQFYIGSAVKIRFNKKTQLSLGANGAFLFGALTKQVRVNFPELTNAITTRRLETLNFRGFTWNTGLLLTQVIKENSSFVTIGVTARPKMATHAERDIIWDRITESNSQVFIADTLNQTGVVDGDIEVPALLSFGVSYSNKNNFLIGADVSFENWGDFRDFGEANTQMVNSTKINFGIGFVPSPKNLGRSFGDYFSRVHYRFGGRYNTGNIVLDGNKISEFAATIGMGLPLRRSSLGSSGTLNLSFEIGQRGSIDNNLIRENFLNTTIGISLNDVWFIKRKFN